MPTVAIADGVAIRFCADEHPPPHFHAVFAEFDAQIAISPPQLLRGSLPSAKLKTVKAAEAAMSDIGRMRSAEAVLFGVVEIVRLDEFEAIVGLGPASEKGELFRFLRNEPERFAAVTLDDFGHSIRSVDNEGDSPSRRTPAGTFPTRQLNGTDKRIARDAADRSRREAMLRNQEWKQK